MLIKKNKADVTDVDVPGAECYSLVQAVFTIEIILTNNFLCKLTK
jgi:hypothetical protein